MNVQTGIKSGKPLGDAIKEFTDATGLVKLAHAYENMTGRSCGCEERRQTLNRLFP